MLLSDIFLSVEVQSDQHGGSCRLGEGALTVTIAVITCPCRQFLHKIFKFGFEPIKGLLGRHLLHVLRIFRTRLCVDDDVAVAIE